MTIGDVSSHDIHQYNIVYVLVAIALGIGVVWIWRNGQCCLRSKTRLHRQGRIPRQQGHQEPQGMPTPLPRAEPTKEPVYSEVQSRKQSTADRQLSASELGESSRASVRFQNLAKRWPCVKCVVNKGKTSLPTPQKPSVFTVEDPLV
ncbi:unnamed protein product [Chilo suppressalis]|uniref:Uncharacterized protein n=1 Tax=Chilo suppressalis TaxID=168631 RepID=A0ABN8AXX3_CHISP|nr:unnamed protein product [Chilo suppressalis]